MSTVVGVMAERRIVVDRQVMIDPMLGLLQKGPGDPTHRKVAGTWWRASRTPEGAVLVAITPRGGEVFARAWGPGRDWALEQLPRLIGEEDSLDGFVPRKEHGSLIWACRRFEHFRVGRTEAVFEAVAPACIEQVVTGKEAYRGWRLLVREFGESAPGPVDDPSFPAYRMCLPPEPQTWARVPSWRFLGAGVEQRRSRPLVMAARRADALERTLAMDSTTADRALRALPGIGVWTSAEVRQRSHGDADAWSIGDYHVGREITWALTGESLDDDACTEILEPYRGHRFRVQMLLGMAGLRPARRGPRRALPTHTPQASRGRS